MAVPFFEVTSVRPTAASSYRAEIDESWNLRPLPQGGVVTAIALRAMEAALADPTQELRTLHTTFVSQVAHGVVDVEVELLRRGRSMSHLRAEVRNPASERGHITTAVFGGPRRGFEFTDLAPPADLPPPSECPSFRSPPPPEVKLAFSPMPFWEQRVEGRAALGHAAWEDYVPDRAERAFWYRFDDPPLLPNGAIDPLSYVVLVDTMPGAVGEKMGPQHREWFAPSIDLTVHLLGEARSPWLLAHNQARWAGEGYASGDMSLWDCGVEGTAAPRLVAYATQLFCFSFPPARA